MRPAYPSETPASASRQQTLVRRKERGGRQRPARCPSAELRGKRKGGATS